MSNSTSRVRRELERPRSPADKVTKWLGTVKEKPSERRKEYKNPAAADYTPPPSNLSKLRERLNHLRAANGSFSSAGSTPDGQTSLIPPRPSRLSLAGGSGKLPGASPTWRISAQSPDTEAPLVMHRPPPRPASITPPKPSTSRSSPLKTPTRTPASSSRTAAYEASPRTPPQTISPLTGLPTGERQQRSAKKDAWEEQLCALERLKRQLDLTAAQIPEESVDQQQYRPGHRPRRSAAEHWKKFQDLAQQLEEAQSQLESIDETFERTS